MKKSTTFQPPPKLFNLPRLTFSSDPHPPSARFGAFCSLFVGQPGFHYQLSSHAAHDFEFEIDVQPMHGIDLIAVRRSSHLLTTLSDADARKSAERLNLQICYSGRIAGSQGGTEIEAKPGDALLIRSDRASSTEFVEPTRMHGIFIDIDRMRPFLKGEMPGEAVLLQADDRPALKLLSAWLRALSHADISLDHDLKSIVAGHIADLIVLTLDARDDAREEAESRTGKFARLHAILDHIATHSHEPISAEDIGAKLGISDRYVRLLLQESGRTLSEHVLEQRLLNAIKLLRDPRFVDHKIADIALQAGFDDISYFNRTFRIRFGDTPSRVRTSSTIENGESRTN